ncbi:hypothetical protein C5167_014537 [Papaver somniferum]|uniref:Uncharacterized protein n=1 Tax=Papaver somniferum TaxID=3469 RepID=A0A4Y7J6K9_PAPSO|nr:hypothetical protein C5167_014537 [Papaver somniferum]
MEKWIAAYEEEKVIHVSATIEVITRKAFVLEEFETYEYARRCTFKVDSFFYRDPDEAKDQETDEGAAPVAYFGVADRISNDQWVVIPNGKRTLSMESIERNLDQRTRRNKKQFWKQSHQFNQTKMIPHVSSNSLSRNVRLLISEFDLNLIKD